MPQIINTNIASLTAQRNLNSSQSANSTALERLSSGLRINSAKDDAAGLAISTRFETQVRGLNVAIRNAGDGISLAQTAEGALGSMTDSLQRIRELAVQSANATNSPGDRQALQAEAEQLIAEITRVGEETNFNGQKLLDGTFSGAFQVGANAGERIQFSVANVTADTLGVGESAGVSAVGTDDALGNGDLNINGVTIGSSSANDDTLSYENAAASSISKSAAINAKSDETGVRAEVDTNIVGGSSMQASAASGSITLNGVSVDIDTTNDAQTSRVSVVSAINAVSDQTGVTAVDSEDDALGVTLMAEDGRNITLDYGGDLTAVNTGLSETTSGQKAVVSAGSDSVTPASALDFSNVEGASISFGVDITTTGLDDLNFSDATTAANGASGGVAPGLGATSFNVETDQGSYAVVLDQDYTGIDTDSLNYLNMVDDINTQISGSGFTAGVDTGGGLTFTQDTAGAGYITLSNGDEGYTGVDTTASITAGAASTATYPLTLDGTMTFEIDSETAGTISSSTITLAAGPYADLDAIVTELNTDIAAGAANVLAVNNGGTLEFQYAGNGVGPAVPGQGTVSIHSFDNTTTPPVLTSDADIDAFMGFSLSSLTTSSGESISSSNDPAAATYGVTVSAGLAANTTAAFGNNAASSVFGEGTNQDSQVLSTSNISAAGRVDAVSFDIATTDSSGTYVNKVTLDESVADLNGLVNAINNSLANDPNSTVSAQVNDGKLSFQTVGNFEGNITVGNFNDGGDQSQTIVGDDTISTTDIDNLFGMSLTTSTTTPSTGSGIKGTVDLDAAGVTKVDLTESSIGTSSAISFVQNAVGLEDTAPAATATLKITLGDRQAVFDADVITTAMGADADGDAAAAAINLALRGTELEGRVEAVTDGATFTFQSMQNTGETLTISAGSNAATEALREVDYEAVDLIFGNIDVSPDLLNDAGATAANGSVGSTNTASATGTAATTANNVLDIDIDGTTTSITVAAGSYSTSADMIDAINTAIDADVTLAGNVKAFAEKDGIAIRQTDASATSTLTISGSGADGMLGADRASDGATTAVIDSSTSEVDGDGNGQVGGADTFEGGFTLVADGDVNDIVITGGDNTGNGDLANAGLASGTYKAGEATINTTSKSATVETTRGAGLAGSVDASGGVDIVGTSVPGTTATLTGLASDFTGNTDFSGNSGDNAVSFDITYTDGEGNSNTATIGLTENITNMNELLDDINDELSVSGLGVTVSNNGGTLEFAAASGDGAGTISIGNVDATFGGSTNGSAEITTSAGAVDAVLGLQASLGVDSDTASGGVGTITFSGQSDDAAFDFSAAAVTFDIDRDGTTVGINLNTAVTDLDDMVSEINTQLSAAGTINVAARNNGGALEIYNSTAAGSGDGEVSDDVLTVDTFAGLGTTGGTADQMFGGELTAFTADTTTGTVAGTLGAYVIAGATAATTTNIAGVDEISEGNTLSFSVDGGTAEEITLSTATGQTTDQIVADINTQLAASTNLQGATAFNEDNKVVIRSNNTNNSGSISAIGGDAAAALGLNATNATEVEKEQGVKGLEAGDLVLNDVSIAAAKDSYDTASYDGADTSDKSASGIAIAKAINNSSDATGVTASVNETVAVGGDGSGASNYAAGDSGNIHINGVDMGTVTLTGNAEDDRRTAVALINEKAGQTGVTAADNGVSITLVAADGRNLSVAIDNNEANNSGSGQGFGAAIGLDSSIAGIGEADITSDANKTTENSYETTYSTVELNSAGEIDVKGGINGNDAINQLGFEKGTFGGATDGQFIADVDISTLEGANAALSSIDNALEKVASERANLGALQNRMDSTVSNLAITSENLSASNSRIRDADFAVESAELSRTQVLQQAGISILAQANQRGQQVLSLLG